MRKVVMLGAGPLQTPAIRCLKDLGCQVACLDWDPKAVGFPLSDRPEVISTLDANAVLDFARSWSADAVITSTTDAPVRTAAWVCEQLGLFTGISYEDSICATNKDAMRDRFAERGVPIPAYRVCTDAESFASALEELRYDCVVKPADSAASRGVVLVNQPLYRAEVVALFEHEIPFSRKGVLMVEERMTGPEVSVESMTLGGETHILTITDKTVTKPPYFVELGHTEPSRLSCEARAEIERVTRSAIEAVGIRQGPSHTEVLVTPQGAKVVEIAARLGGDYITSRLVPLSTGIDMVRASVLAALDMPVNLEKGKVQGSAIRFVTCGTGIVDSIDVDPAIHNLSGFEEIGLYKEPGDSISAPHSSNDRVGHVICIGEDAQAAADAADRALSMVKVHLV